MNRRLIDLKKILRSQIDDTCFVKKNLIAIEKDIFIAIEKMYKKLNSGGKLIFCGNGGSAADAQHLAAEFLVRLRPNVNRRPFSALSLAQDTSTITAYSNDYRYEDGYARCLEGLGRKNKDVLIAITTSGNSKNIINVLKIANKMNIFTIGLLGNSGGKALKYCKLPLVVKSSNTARIQESHIFLGHFILEQVENILIKNNKR